MLSKEKNVDNAYIEELLEKIGYLENSNSELYNDNVGLHDSLEDLKTKYSQVVVTNTDVSSKNVLSATEKLKVE